MSGAFRADGYVTTVNGALERAKATLDGLGSLSRRLAAQGRAGGESGRSGSAQVIMAEHACAQYLRRGHYELGIYASPRSRLGAAFDELERAL